MGIVNRRNAVLGWSVWTIGKRIAKRKAKSTAPSVEGGRPNKSLLALAIAAVGLVSMSMCLSALRGRTRRG